MYLFAHFREKRTPDGEQVHNIVTRDVSTTPYPVARKKAFEAANPGVTIAASGLKG